MKNLHPFLRSNCNLILSAFFLVLACADAAAQPACLNGWANTQESQRHNTAKPSPTPLRFQDGPPLGQITYKIAGDASTYTLDDFLGKFCTTGFLVLKGDQVVFEKFLQGRKPSDTLLSASMSKSILSLIVGIAVNEGKISLSEEIGDILPDFKNSAFTHATVEDVMRMASGATLLNSFEPGAESDNRATNPIVSPNQNVRSYMSRKKEISAEPGKTFAYNGAQTAVLGAVMAERLGNNLTAYLEQKIWIPMGAESAGYWIKNWYDEEGVQGQFVATLRDYGRLGYLVMNKGQANGRQIIPAEWIEKMTTLDKSKPQPANPPYYGLHIWIPRAANGRSMFWGTNGQNVFIDPIQQVVIVHTGNSPKAEFDGNRHLFALRDAIVRKLSAPPYRISDIQSPK